MHLFYNVRVMSFANVPIVLALVITTSHDHDNKAL